MGNDSSQITVIIPHRDDYDPRIIQATRWYSADTDSVLGFRTLNQYLATIPPVSETLVHPREDLPLLTLLERRIGNTAACKIAGLKYGCFTDRALVHVDERHRLPMEPIWIRAHNGIPNINREPSVCLAECIGNRLAGIDSVGIAIYLVHEKGKHTMDLPGSVHFGSRRSVYVDPFDSPLEGPKLDERRNKQACPKCGTVVFVLE